MEWRELLQPDTPDSMQATIDRAEAEIGGSLDHPLRPYMEMAYTRLEALRQVEADTSVVGRLRRKLRED
jgi:hypothetical protein